MRLPRATDLIASLRLSFSIRSTVVVSLLCLRLVNALLSNPVARLPLTDRPRQLCWRLNTKDAYSSLSRTNKYLIEQIAHTKGKLVGKMFVTSGTHPVAVGDILFGVAVIVRLPTSIPSNLQD